MADLLNVCRFQAGSSGTSDFADGAAIIGFKNIEDAGAVDAAVYPYRAENASRTQWEIGYATALNTSGGWIFERTYQVDSSDGGSKVDFSTSPIIMVSPLKSGFLKLCMASEFGANENASDNSAALKAWLAYIVENNRCGVLDGNYDVTDAITIPAPSNTDIRFQITGLPGCGINYTATTRKDILLELYFDHLKECTVADIRLNGGDYCSTGLRVRGAASAPESLIVRNVIVNDCRIKTGAGSGGFGILVYSENAYPGGYAEVTGCVVEEVSKDNGISLAAVGISVVNFSRWKVEHNRVSGVYHDGTNLQDADGISIFAGNASSIYNKETGSCCHNDIRNALGRGIKLQTNGNAYIGHNTITLAGSHTLIAEFRAIDSQFGNSVIEDNWVFADDQWSGASAAAIFCLQTPDPISGDNERVTVGLRKNQLWTKKQFNSFCRCVARDVAVDIEFQIEGNRAYGNQALADTDNTKMGANIFTQVGMVALTNGGKFRIRASNNEVQANNWFLNSGSGLSGDYYASVFMEIRNNTMHPLSVAQPVFASGGTWYTSDLLVADNNIGGTSGARIDNNLDLTKLRPGCSFYLGSGTNTGGPLGAQFKSLEKLTRLHTRLSSLSLTQVTDDNGSNWRTTIHNTDLSISAQHADITNNSNVTIGPSSGFGPLITLSGTLTADRTMTLSTTGAIEGQTRFKINRTGGGAFNWSIGGLKNLATGQWCEVAYNGSAYYLVAFGSL